MHPNRQGKGRRHSWAALFAGLVLNLFGMQAMADDMLVRASDGVAYRITAPVGASPVAPEGFKVTAQDGSPVSVSNRIAGELFAAHETMASLFKDFKPNADKAIETAVQVQNAQDNMTGTVQVVTGLADAALSLVPIKAIAAGIAGAVSGAIAGYDKGKEIAGGGPLGTVVGGVVGVGGAVLGAANDGTKEATAGAILQLADALAQLGENEKHFKETQRAIYGAAILYQASDALAKDSNSAASDLRVANVKGEILDVGAIQSAMERRLFAQAYDNAAYSQMLQLTEGDGGKIVREGMGNIGNSGVDTAGFLAGWVANKVKNDPEAAAKELYAGIIGDGEKLRAEVYSDKAYAENAEYLKKSGFFDEQDKLMAAKLAVEQQRLAAAKAEAEVAAAKARQLAEEAAKAKAEAEKQAAALQKDLNEMGAEMSSLASKLAKAGDKASLERALDKAKDEYDDNNSRQKMLTNQVGKYQEALKQLTGKIPAYEFSIQYKTWDGKTVRETYTRDDVPTLQERISEQTAILDQLKRAFSNPGGLKDQYEAAKDRLAVFTQIETQQVEAKAKLAAAEAAMAKALAEARAAEEALKSNVAKADEAESMAADAFNRLLSVVAIGESDLAGDFSAQVEPPAQLLEEDDQALLAERNQRNSIVDGSVGSSSIRYSGTVAGSLSLVGDYRFENNGNNSYSGAGATGNATAIGTPLFVAGPTGQALHVFGDAGDQDANAMRVTAASGFQPGSDSFIFDALVRKGADSQFVVVGLQGGDYDEGATMRVIDGGKANVALDSGGVYGSYPGQPESQNAVSTAIQFDGTWQRYRVIVDRETGLLRAIANGKEVISTALTLVGSIDPSMDMLFGAYDYITARNGFARLVAYDGYMDNISMLHGQFGDIEPLQARINGGTATLAQQWFMSNWDGKLKGNSVYFLVDDGTGNPAVGSAPVEIDLNIAQTSIDSATVNGESITIASSYFNQKNDLGMTGTNSGGAANVWMQSSADPDLLQYDYMTWGTWQQDEPTAGATGSDPQTHVASPWIAGRLTPDNEVPTAGSASYSGSVNGLLAFGGNTTGLSGQVALTANFGTRTLSGNFSNMVKDDGVAWKDLTVNANWNGGVNSISGTVSGAGVAGVVNGNFFGPAAAEVGGTWKASGGGESAAGVYRAKQ